jgi:hypothetical protein
MADVPRAANLKEVPWATYKLTCMFTFATFVVPRVANPREVQWPHINSKYIYTHGPWLMF